MHRPTQRIDQSAFILAIKKCPILVVLSINFTFILATKTRIKERKKA
jgi:hypothetical protein